MNVSKLSSEQLRHFKTEITDENRLISNAIRQLIPADLGGVILDVGAGLGDIASSAFPDRRTVLIDVLEFVPGIETLHQRQKVDFFEFRLPPGEKIDVMLLSHVTQYIDDDIGMLASAIRNLDPAYLIVVSNSITPLHIAIDQWFNDRGLSHNAEQVFDICPMPELRRIKEVNFTSHLRCMTFPELAFQLTSMIYDADLTPVMVEEFAGWLRDRLNEPCIEIPQSVILYRKGKHVG